MKFFIFAFVILIAAFTVTSIGLVPVDIAPSDPVIGIPVEVLPECPRGQIYQKRGPGPYCYPTCCGPRGPPCHLDSFTSGCFCRAGFTKAFPVENNTFIEPFNPCVKSCSSFNCNRCTKAHEEWRDCGPTYMCDNQVCRGMRPICLEEDAATCVAGCFCQTGYSRYNGECISKCPLLP